MPRVIQPPPNGFPLGDALQLAPGAQRLHPPPFLPVEEKQLLMEAPHQSPRGPKKTLDCVKSPAAIGSGMGDRGFPGRSFHAHTPLCTAKPPRHLCCGPDWSLSNDGMLMSCEDQEGGVQ